MTESSAENEKLHWVIAPSGRSYATIRYYANGPVWLYQKCPGKPGNGWVGSPPTWPDPLIPLDDEEVVEQLWATTP